jgi:hypothetical protein
MSLKRLLISVLAAVSIVIISLIPGLIVREAGYENESQTFIGYTLGWAFWLVGFFPDNRPDSRQWWAAVLLSWVLNIGVFSLIIYLVQLWRSKRKNLPLS